MTWKRGIESNLWEIRVHEVGSLFESNDIQHRSSSIVGGGRLPPPKGPRCRMKEGLGFRVGLRV